MQLTKKALALLLSLLLIISITASCGSNDAKADDTTTAAETEPPFDMSEVTINPCYYKMADGNVYLLSFSGFNATFQILEDNKLTTITGAFSGTATTMTIGDTTYNYELGNSLELTSGDTSYKLSKGTADNATQYQGFITLLTNNWTGDGASLAFNADGTATLKIAADGIDNTGSYMLSATSIRVKNETAGDPVNYALNCTTDSSTVEADTYPAAYAVDGDTGTRFASGYFDPSWFTVDLGESKSIGAVKINWEAAYASEYELRVSEDNENWTTIYNCKEITSAGDDEHTFDTVNARYVQMYGISRATTYGYSFFEFEVYNFLSTTANVSYAVNGDSLTITSGETTYTLAKG